jgi:carbamoyl-phosphate synthase small subunit
LVSETVLKFSEDTISPFSNACGARVAVVDCGIKNNILRSLDRRGAEVVVVPFTATASDILSLNPAGILVSNGPGDPALLPGPVATVRDLIPSGIPFLGICLGHQILGRAIGATTSRLKFGHHGSNHPVMETVSGRVHITSQNHEFQVDRDSIPNNSGFYVSQFNLNDNSVEGLAHRELAVFSVQYHPEGCPGPQDNQYLFDRFVEMVGSRCVKP